MNNILSHICFSVRITYLIHLFGADAKQAPAPKTSNKRHTINIIDNSNNQQQQAPDKNRQKPTRSVKSAKLRQEEQTVPLHSVPQTHIKDDGLMVAAASLP